MNTWDSMNNPAYWGQYGQYNLANTGWGGLSAQGTSGMPTWGNQAPMPRFTAPDTVTGVSWDVPTWQGYNANQLAATQAYHDQLRQWAALAAQTQQAQAEYAQHQYEFGQTFPWQQQTDTWAHELGSRGLDIQQQANEWANQLAQRQQQAVEQQQAWQQQWLPQQQQNQIRAEAANAALAAWGRTQRPNVRYI